MLRVLDLFSGIGGFSLGLERAGGFITVAFCEINPSCRDVLRTHWPDPSIPIYEDIRDLTANSLWIDGVTVDVICGGFPCQDISTAGKQAGLQADRSGLWFEYLRLIGELRPRYVIVENVTNLLRGPSERPGEWFGVVLGGLAQIGYNALWDCIPASAIGAPHIRDRVWLIAQPQHTDAYEDGCGWRPRGDFWPAQFRNKQGGDVAPLRGEMANADASGRARTRSPQPEDRRRDPVAAGRSAAVADANREPMERPAIAREERHSWEVEPNFRRVVDGLSDELDGERRFAVGALGNAVVPGIPELIGRAILQAHGLKSASGTQNTNGEMDDIDRRIGELEPRPAIEGRALCL